jgi:hypothetical protein
MMVGERTVPLLAHHHPWGPPPPPQPPGLPRIDPAHSPAGFVGCPGA